MNTQIKINSPEDLNRFMRNLLSRHENKGAKLSSRKTTAHGASRMQKSIQPKMNREKTKSNAEIIAGLNGIARQFNNTAGGSQASNETSNSSGYSPQRVKANREKRFSKKMDTQDLSESEIRKARIRAGKVYGTTSQKTRSGYNPAKVRQARAQRKLREERSKNEPIFQGGGPGKSAVVYAGRSEDMAGAPYDPAKVRELRAQRKADDDNQDDLRMSYASTRGRVRF